MAYSPKHLQLLSFLSLFTAVLATIEEQRNLCLLEKAIANVKPRKLGLWIVPVVLAPAAFVRRKTVGGDN
jgi:hypothetical protein